MVPAFLRSEKAGQVRDLPLSAREIVLGRRPDMDIVLDDRSVSRRHAKLVRTTDGYRLTDLQSTYGTFVNDRKIDEHLLQHGDRIRLGRLQVEFVFVDGPFDESASEAGTAEDRENFRDLTATLFSPAGGGTDLEKISRLLDLQFNWEREFSPDRMFRKILQYALEISGAERSFVLIRRPEGFVYQSGRDGFGRPLSQSEFAASRTVTRQVAETGRPVFMVEGLDDRLAMQDSVMALRLKAVACLPLTGISSPSDRSNVLGILYLDSTRTMHSLSGLDEKILGRLAQEAGNILEKLEMIRGLQEREQLEKDLTLAQETQEGLLPRDLPRIPGFRVGTFSRPTRYVSGDFYDFLEVGPDRLAAVLADVSGKGIGAALLSSFLQGTLEVVHRIEKDPARALNRVNRIVFEKTGSDRFVTLFLFTVDRNGNGQYVSAGHNPAFLFRAADGRLEELPSAGLILGAFDFTTYEGIPFQLLPGDILTVYSDGLTDAENPSGEMLGEERLRAAVREAAIHGLEALQERILQEVESFTSGVPQNDDITFLLVQRES